MANYVRQAKQHDRFNGGTHVHTTEVAERSPDSGIVRAQQVVYYIASIASGLLFIRLSSSKSI